MHLHKMVGPILLSLHKNLYDFRTRLQGVVGIKVLVCSTTGATPRFPLSIIALSRADQHFFDRYF